MNQGYTRTKAAGAALAFSLMASTAVWAEVYRWTDENGVTHFSQTPPPAGQEADIADVPDSVPAQGQAPAAGIDFDGSGTAADPGMSAADLRRQEIAESRDRQQSEREALEALCRQTRNRLELIEPNRRVYYTDEDGETVRMDDQERVDEVEQLRNFIDNNCP